MLLGLWSWKERVRRGRTLAYCGAALTHRQSKTGPSRIWARHSLTKLPGVAVYPAFFAYAINVYQDCGGSLSSCSPVWVAITTQNRSRGLAAAARWHSSALGSRSKASRGPESREKNNHGNMGWWYGCVWYGGFHMSRSVGHLTALTVYARGL